MTRPSVILWLLNHGFKRQPLGSLAGGAPGRLPQEGGCKWLGCNLRGFARHAGTGAFAVSRWSNRAHQPACGPRAWARYRGDPCMLVNPTAPIAHTNNNRACQHQHDAEGHLPRRRHRPVPAPISRRFPEDEIIRSLPPWNVSNPTAAV
jgi:hypothetical protein